MAWYCIPVFSYNYIVRPTCSSPFRNRFGPTIEWCKPLGFLSTPGPVTALASFPGSGNTWLRYLIQQATGEREREKNTLYTSHMNLYLYLVRTEAGNMEPVWDARKVSYLYQGAGARKEVIYVRARYPEGSS